NFARNPPGNHRPNLQTSSQKSYITPLLSPLSRKISSVKRIKIFISSIPLDPLKMPYIIKSEKPAEFLKRCR
ncbi:MAG: hypothetical protein LBH49_03685, partial [Puniceicoccales bacterium]|nr:hypothetical protein [Puniceicoccales bacterium]